jgi:organic hydroperoxide reductase OsmC/OhrA
MGARRTSIGIRWGTTHLLDTPNKAAGNLHRRVAGAKCYLLSLSARIKNLRFRASGSADPSYFSWQSGSMANRKHEYRILARWTGNLGAGTSSYRSYSRNHELSSPEKVAAIPGSSDPAFRGDASRYNPEELLLAALSSCHMLWMLHLCADAGIVIVDYTDDAIGEMEELPDGAGQFTRVLLRPRMTITDSSKIEEAVALHDRAHHFCYIARSVNFPVEHEPVVVAERRAMA